MIGTQVLQSVKSFINRFGGKRKIYYLTENSDWVIKRIGGYLLEYLSKQTEIEMTVDIRSLKKSVLHFGSRNLYLPKGYLQSHKSNRVIFTWFHHGTDRPSAYTQALPEGAKRAAFIHTSCQISKQQLIHWGAKEGKIVVIPLGVDLRSFRPFSEEEKALQREALGIPQDVFLIGSFQKDGNGWGEGTTPKLNKGPDIFCDVVARLHQDYPVYVLLTGPARGYVKQRLHEQKIPFQHVYLEDYRKIGELFALLDLYIVASRAEGGPLALLESLASGVPLVSTSVGMAPDILLHGENGFLAQVEAVEELCCYAQTLFDDPTLRQKFISNGLTTVQQYDWKIIANQYYDSMYSVLM